MTATALAEGSHAPPAIAEVEQYGIEPIPPADRTATPFDLFRVAFGGANTFATVVVRGMAAWIPAAVVGLLFVNIPGQFDGPRFVGASDAEPPPIIEGARRPRG
jgi:hypothetical protein